MTKRKRNILIALAVVLIPIIVWIVSFAIDVSQYASAVAEEAHQQFVESKSQMLAAGFTGVVIQRDNLISEQRAGKICYLMLQITNTVNQPKALHYYNRYSFINAGRLHLMVPCELFDAAAIGDTITKQSDAHELELNGAMFMYLNHDRSEWLAE